MRLRGVRPATILAHLAHHLRLLHPGRGGVAAEAVGGPHRDVPEDVHHHAGVVGRDRPPGLGDDVRLRHLLARAHPLQAVDDVAHVLVEGVVERGRLVVGVGADVVDAEAAPHVEVVDGEPHLAQLGVDARALVHRVLHHPDVGELGADVEVEEPDTPLPAALPQDVNGLDELGDGEAELGEVAGAALPLPGAPGGELGAEPDHGLHAQLVGQPEELGQLGELLDDHDDLAAELAAEQGQPEELLVLVAVADGDGLGVGVEAEHDEQLALGARLQAVVVGRAGVEDLLDHLAHLVHLHGVDAVVAAAVPGLGDALAERFVDRPHAGAQHVLEAHHAGEAEPPLLDVLHHVHHVDGRTGLAVRVHHQVPLVAHREVAAAPPGHVVVERGALHRPAGGGRGGGGVALGLRKA